MEVDDLKGRIAEALVESIFRRASYRVARVGRESSVQGLVKVGASEFSPDFPRVEAGVRRHSRPAPSSALDH